jgi:N-acetyl sugar amidotransferase
MSTRPRISFDDRGWCNACQWMEEKRTFNWGAREKELKDILEKYRSKTGGFDCIVPVSGGKDGGYVAYNLKQKCGMHPLTVTVEPALSLEVGNKNLENFKAQGYDHVLVSPNPEIMRKLNLHGFVEMGFPYFGWLVAIFSTVIRVALAHNTSLIFYSEDGEVEYGGSIENKNVSLFGIDYMKKIYFEGGYEKVMNKVSYTDQELYYWKFPPPAEVEGKDLFLTHWGYFEGWDPYRNYLHSKNHYKLEESDSNNAGTFTNFAQTDQALYSLHAYMMYLKLGFGRATQDAGIEIRRGAMTRDQAVNLVRLYDGHYPEEFIDSYLDYYQISLEKFDSILDKWANKELFKKISGRWTPKFRVK